MNQRATKILVIEDDRTTRTVLVKRLENLGFEVFAPEPDNTFHERVLGVANEEPLQIVICDITLPDAAGHPTKVQGLEFLRQLAKVRKDKGFTILAHSGTCDAKSIEWVKRMGASAVFPKSQPDSLELLLTKVKEIAEDANKTKSRSSIF